MKKIHRKKLRTDKPMKQIREIMYQDHKIVDIDLSEATQEVLITDSDIRAALKLLYNAEDVKIIEFTLSPFERLQKDLVYDYVIRLEADGEEKIALNFGCSFLDCQSAHAIVNYRDEEITDSLSAIKSVLQLIRADRYDKNPKYYEQYAKDILEIYNYFDSIIRSEEWRCRILS